jgi:hypothetical protein
LGGAAHILTAALKGERNSFFAAAWLIPVVVVLALAIPAVGQAAEPGSISGTVTAKVGGAPVNGVEVCAEGQTEEAFGCAGTKISGQYEIDELPPGEYKVKFWARGLGYANQFYDGQVSWAAATPVTVTAGMPTTGIDAELEEGATISGRVTAAATGLPVEDVEVCAERTDEEDFGCGSTNATGSYTIGELSPGQYQIYFYTYETGQNLLSQPYGLGVVTLAAGARQTGIDAALQTGGQIGGTVRAAATGTPLKGVEVCLTEASETWPLACLMTPPSGAYRFYGVWTGSFKVVFSPQANELEEGEGWGIEPDSYPTQWWNGQPSFATATPIAVTAGVTVGDINGSLGPGPVAPPSGQFQTIVVPMTNPSKAPAEPSTAPGPAPGPKPAPKPLKCKHTFVKKTVKGKARCVRRHKAKHRGGKHHAQPRNPAPHS